jgi:hypothetical protein
VIRATGSGNNRVTSQIQTVPIWFARTRNWQEISMFGFKRLGGIGAVAGLAALGIAAMPGSAHAWWRGGIGLGIYVPPVVVAPPAVYAPPAYYAPPPVVYAPPVAAYPGPARVWIPPHWEGPYWVRGHWS